MAWRHVLRYDKKPSQPHSTQPLYWNAFGKQLNCVNNVPFAEIGGDSAQTLAESESDCSRVFFFEAEGLEVV